MLEVKNLVKVYKTKGGVTVRALDDVSLKFPETGMIFLLGKSGSGKSTLLNVTGGLDKPDSGEIIIKGKNSKSFSGADFDSYRNTYIGFIFQEYNILDEFNIEQNISLALQLQGKPNDKKAVEAILEQVDLSGYGRRKPNTLSGGQKQRVAIARALIKDPEIIMADEPTGALDSNTGKQVFDTLKKLSKDKLVIIVSHDRDFAEHYADRIIELSDGKVISDVSKEYVTPVAVSGNINVINGNTVTIRDTSKLTSSDMEEILKVLKEHQGEALISSNQNDLPSIKQTIHMSEDGSSEVFNQTEKIETKEYDGTKTKFIRSHLPFSRAFKMGASSIKTKPIRLIFTMLLNIVALVMFGLTSTLMLFNESYSVSVALKNAIYVTEAVTKEYKYTTHNYQINQTNGSKTETYTYTGYNSTYFGESEVQNFNKAGLNYVGMFNFSIPSQWSSRGITINNVGPQGFDDYYGVHSYISGFVDSWGQSDGQIASLMVGTYPSSVEEVALPYYLAEGFKRSYEYQDLNELLGKEITLRISNSAGNAVMKLKISGVFQSSSLNSKFDKLKLTDGSLSQKEKSELTEEFASYLHNSYHTIVFVHPDFFEANKEGIMENGQNRGIGGGSSTIVHGVAISDYARQEIVDRDSGYSYLFDSDLSAMKNAVNFYDLDGNRMEYAPLNNELDIYLPYYYLTNFTTEETRELVNRLCDMFYESNRVKTSTLYALTSEQADEYQSNLEELRYNYSGFAKQDIEYLNSLLSTYYVEYAKNAYDIKMMKTMYDGGYSARADISDTEFEEFNNKKNQLENSIPYDYSNIESIRDYLARDPNQYLKHQVIMSRASDYMYREDRGDIRELVDKFNQERSLEEREWQILEDYVLSTGLAPEDFVYNSNYQVNDHISFSYNKRWYYSSYNGQKGQLNVKGFYQANGDNALAIKDSLATKYGLLDEYSNKTITESDYIEVSDPKYSYIITPTSYTQEQVGEMLKDYGSFRLRMTDGTYQNMLTVLYLVEQLKTAFLIIGIVFAAFAALMLFNFISTSITSKTKEIGILRAVGARGSDLFKIFFSESGLVSLICVLISVGISIYVSIILNQTIIEKVGIALLDFGLINIGIMAAGAALIAFIGTFLPVLLASRKPPVESIRTL